MNNYELRSVRDFGQILSDSFTYLRIHIVSLGKALLLLGFPIIVIFAIFFSGSFGDLMMAQNDFYIQENPNQSVKIVGQMFLGLISFFLNFLVICVIVYKHISLIDEGIDTRDIDLKMLTQNIVGNVFGLAAIFVVIGIATIIGFLLLIIPGIYLSTKLSLAPSIYIIEDETIGGALNKSWQATEGFWWFTFGMSFVMSMIVNFASYIFLVPMYILIGFISFTSGDASNTVLGSVVSMLYGLSMIVPVLLYCFPAVSQALVYFNSVERKSGRTMFDKIESLGDQ